MLLKDMVGPCGLEPQTSTVSMWTSSLINRGKTGLEIARSPSKL